MSKSNSLENSILDHILGGPDYTRLANVWVALYTAAPSDAGGGTEVSGGSYARVQVANNATKWPAASGGVKQNGEDIVFPTPTANWGTVTHFGIHGHATNDALMYWGALASSKVIQTGDPTKFPAGDLTITED